MRVVCVHYPRYDEPPDSIYWVGDDGQLHSYEAEVRYSVLSGADTMLQKVPELRWFAYFEQLAQRTPNPENWDTFEMADTADPADFLATLRRIAVRG